MLRDAPPLPAAEAARLAGCGAGVVRELIAAGLVDERLVAGEPADRADAGVAPARAGACRPTSTRPRAGWSAASRRAGSASPCSTASPARARPRPISPRSPRRSPPAARCWCCCRRSPSARNGSSAFATDSGVLPAEWHSEIGQTERRDTWRAVAAGRARVVVGARSALFLPFAELGLIVVDEEHDPSYKQEDGVCYQARDMAVLRASLAEIPIVLVSATPSLETVVNVARGRYQRVALPRRHAAAQLPAVAPCRHAARAARAWPLSVAAAGRWARRDLGGRRAGAAVSQPARLCAADPVPRLRPSLPMPELHRLAGRAPVYRPAAVPSLRPCRAGAGAVPGMPDRRDLGRMRAGGRAAGRRGRGAVPGSAHRADGQRSPVGAARRSGTRRRR